MEVSLKPIKVGLYGAGSSFAITSVIVTTETEIEVFHAPQTPVSINVLSDVHFRNLLYHYTSLSDVSSQIKMYLGLYNNVKMVRLSIYGIVIDVTVYNSVTWKWDA